MNVGLNSKRNLPLITNSFGTNDTAYLNLDKNNANLIINIPTINKEEGVENKIGDIFLTYSYLNRNDVSSKGKGIGIIDIFKSIVDIVKDGVKLTSVTVPNGDKTMTVYSATENIELLKNVDTDSFVEVIYNYDSNGNPLSVKRVRLYDNVGNYYQYNYVDGAAILDPVLLHKVNFADEDNIEFSDDTQNPRYIRYKNQQIEFYYNNQEFLKYITFKVNNDEYSYCDFIYDNGYLKSCLKRVKHINDEGSVVYGLVEHKEYVFNETDHILVKNAINGNYTKYFITNEKVTSYVNCLNDSESSGKTTTISYYDSYAKVTNYKGQDTKYYLKDGRVVSTTYHNGKISTINYDETGRVIEKLDALDMSEAEKVKRGNVFTSGSTFESGSYTVENMSGTSFVNVQNSLVGTKELSVYNDSLVEDMEIKFIINDIFIRKNEGVTFIANAQKLASTNYLPLEFKICLYNKNRPNYLFYDQTFFAKSKEIYGQIITTSAMCVAYDTYNTAEVTIKVPSNNSRYIISNMQLYCDLFGVINEYDSYGCLSKTWSRTNVRSRSFIKEDKRLLLIGTNSDINGSVFNYDDYGNATEIINGDGTRVEKKYDSNGNCTSQKVINKNNKYFESSTTYTPDGLKVASEINNEGVTTSYEYDQYNRVLKKATYPNGLVDEITYNNKLFIEKQKTIAETNKTVSKYFTFNSNDRLETVNLNNSFSYKFEYDTYGNVISTKLVKNTTLTELEKDTYEVINNVYTENLQTKRVGNVDSNNNKRKYSYDSEDRLEKVYLVESNVETLLYEFEYDNLGNLIKIIDQKYNEEINFSYDKYNNIIQEETIKGNLSVKTNYRYDLKGNLLSSNEIIGNTNLGHYIYNNGERKFKSPAKLYNYYNNIKNLYNCLLLSKDSSGNVKADLIGSSGVIKHIDTTKIPSVIEYGDGIVKAFNLSNSIHKDLTFKHSLNKTTGTGNTFAFWFKTSSYATNNNKTLFSICDLSDSGSKNTKYDIALSSDGKIKFYGSSVTTSNAINLNAWNFISFKLSQNDSGATLTVMLNGVVSTLTTSNKLTSEYQQICFGDYVQNQESSYGTTGEITCLFMSDTLLDDVTIKEIYKQTKESYIDYVSLNNDRFNKHFVTNRIDNNAEYNIIPLKNSLEDLNNSLEYQFEENELFINELDNLFKYDDNFNDYVYNAEGHKLVYKVPYSATMNIGVKALIKELSGNQMILEFANPAQGLIGLYVDSAGLLKGYINNTVINTGVTILPNTVNKYFISFYLSDFNPQTHMYVYKVSIMLNGNILVSSFYEVTSELQVEKIVVGSSLNTSAYNNFNGLMNMLCINTADSSLTNTLNLDAGDKIVDKVNNMGQLFEHQVLKDNQNIIKHNVTYKVPVDSSNNKCYNTIVKDEFFTNSLNSSIRKIDYQNDSNTGNVTRRTLCNQTQILDDVLYVYDKFGQLIEERNTVDDLKIVYSYDRLGNLLGKYEYQLSTNTIINRINFEYHTYNPSKLITYTKNDSSKTINYHDNMLGMPKNIVDDSTGNILCSFDWDFRRLSKYTINSNYYIDYTYNSNGLRTSKVINDENAGGTIIHNYRYSGNNLIEEVVNNTIRGSEYKLNYLYDQFGKLYGFKYNNNTYYYLRDSLQTIIGIVDSTKQLVCEYKYDAYGNHTVLNANRAENTISTFIGNLNPFRYKGYYYDTEASLFWLSSKYYSPELCRFISPADVSSLNPTSINGLNLYSYSNNNPISNFYNNSSIKVASALSSSVVPTNMNVALLPGFIVGTTNNTSTNPLSFSVGLLTPEKYDMPSWMSVYAFYAKGTLGWGYTFGDGYSLASFSAGILDATFHTPKWFSSLPDDHWANPNIYLGFGTWNVNASVGAGISGTAEIISGTVGIQFGDAISIGVKGYVGIGFTIDFTNGIKFGVGLGLGYEISLNIDWYELFH